MTYQILTTREWRYRHPKKGITVLPPGTHNVPADLPEASAELAVSQGMARKLNPPATPPKPAGLPELLVKPEPEAEAVPVKKKRGRPRKGPAPENKALHVAENK